MNEISKQENTNIEMSLEEIEIRLDMLIKQTNIHFLEMGKLLNDIKNKFKDKNSTNVEFLNYCKNRFNFSERTVNRLLTVYVRFGEGFNKGMADLPFNNYTMLAEMAHLDNEEINELLNDTFVTSKGEEKKGRELKERELREVLKEKKEIESQLKKAQEDKEKEIQEKEKLIASLVKEKELLKAESASVVEKKIAEERTKLARIIEGQLKAQLADDIMKSKNLREQAQKEKAEAEAELLKLQGTKSYISRQQKENDRIIGIINEKEAKMEKYDADRRALEDKIRSLEDSIVGLSGKEKDLKEGMNRLKNINEFLTAINEATDIINEFKKESYNKYWKLEDIRKYIIPAVKTVQKSIDDFDKKLEMYSGVVVESDNVIDIIESEVVSYV